METKLYYTVSFNTIDTPQLTDIIETQMGLNNTDPTKPINFSLTYSPPSLCVSFNFEATQNQIDKCNNIVNNFQPQPNYRYHNYFKINNSLESPLTLDYDILGLNKKRTIINGELRIIEYYKEYDYSAKTYSDLYVSEYRDYVRDQMGLVQYRIQTSNWLLNDNTTGLTKNFIKYYTEEESIQEGITRRNNVLDVSKTTLLNELKIVFGFPLNQSYAFDLLTSVKTELDYFEQGYTQPLRDAVSASTKSYMLENIKIAVINKLTY